MQKSLLLQFVPPQIINALDYKARRRLCFSNTQNCFIFVARRAGCRIGRRVGVWYVESHAIFPSVVASLVVCIIALAY